jgi:hypothetical protein
MRLKRQVLLLTVVFTFIVVPVIANAATPKERDGFEPKTDIDIWIDAWSWHRYYWTDLDAGNTIYVDVEVTSGPGMDFFFCDQANWDIWDSGGTASVYGLSSNVGSVSTSFTVPTQDTWIVVFDSDSIYSLHVEGWVGLSPAPVATSPNNNLTFTLVIIVVIVVIGAVGVAFVKQITGSNQTPLQTSQDVYTSPPKSDQAFCPYCGHPRQGMDAGFCAKCGRSFAGPEFQ